MVLSPDRKVREKVAWNVMHQKQPEENKLGQNNEYAGLCDKSQNLLEKF